MYLHTQRSPLCLLLYGSGVALVIGTPFPTNRWVALASGTMFLFAASFHFLRVQDQGEVLAIRFGPVPLFRKSIAYADIRSVELGRTMIIESWGIHFSPRGGWVWNLWGRDCVVLHLRHGRFRLGTDDVGQLICHVQRQIDLNPSCADTEP